MEEEEKGGMRESKTKILFIKIILLQILVA
jgi:hypothetical protein